MLNPLLQSLRDLATSCWGFVEALPWHRFLLLPEGALLALAALLVFVLLGWLNAGVVVLLRLREWRWPSPQPLADDDPNAPRKNWVMRTLFWLVLFLIPFGITAAGAVAAVMGTSHWRRQATYIVGLSLVPALALGWLASPYFPLSGTAWMAFVSGFIGVVFAVLQLWALIKVLRQCYGEPIVEVPWWPPLMLWLQAALLCSVSGWVLLHR